MKFLKIIQALGIFVIISNVCIAQSLQIQILSTDKPLGRNLLDNQEIIGKEYIFPDRIYKTYLDETNGYLTVQLRGLSRNGKYLNNNGTVMLFDLNSNELKWSKKLAYQSSDILQYNNMLIQTVGTKSYCLDIESGKELWELKNDIYYVDPLNDIGIGYKHENSTGFSHKLEGIDLNNGNIIWERELNREYGWNSIFHQNDSILIIVAGGLHSLNIKNGNGWNYSTVTGEKDYTATAATNVLGVASGLLTGNFFLSTGHNLVRDLVSNVHRDSTAYFIASKKEISSISIEDGQLNWSTSFPEGYASKSMLLRNDTALLVINRGFAFMGYRQLDFGKPFIASFDRFTGKQHYLAVIMVEKDPILGIQIVDDELFLVFKNRLAKYSIETGAQITEKTILSATNGDLKYFIGDQAYVARSDGTYGSLNSLDSTKLCVFTASGNTLIIDTQLNIVDTVDVKELVVNYLDTGDYRFIAKENNTSILNSAGEVIAEVNASSNAFLIDNKLYDHFEDRFKFIDLSQVFDIEKLNPQE